MSKGSKRRPMRVPKEVFEDNWDRVFGKPQVRKGTKARETRVHKNKKHDYFVEEDFDVNVC